MKCKTPTANGGLLFLVVPLACVDNSRYMTQDLMSKMLMSLGFAVLEQKTSKKLAFYMLELVERKPPQAAPQIFKKQVIRHGGDKNNFFIHIDPTYTIAKLKEEKAALAAPGAAKKSAKRKRGDDDDVVASELDAAKVVPAAKKAKKTAPAASKQATEKPKRLKGVDKYADAPENRPRTWAI